MALSPSTGATIRSRAATLAQLLSPEVNRLTRLHPNQTFGDGHHGTPPRASSFAMDQKAAPRLWMQEARYGRATAGEAMALGALAADDGEERPAPPESRVRPEPREPRI